MAKAGKRLQIKMQSTESAYCYYTQKSKINTPDRIELKKYDPVLRKHVGFKEAK